jgi:hypothetical protein
MPHSIYLTSNLIIVNNSSIRFSSLHKTVANMADSDDVEAVNFHSSDLLHLHQHMITKDHLGSKTRRNIWTEAKNAALVELVRNSPYPTPWRPAHGTNKEIWLDITRQMANMPEIFDFPILWEAAKEQLLKIIDRQKMRRSLGDYEVKTVTERYIDEMIKHMMAEDAEKALRSSEQRERNENRDLRKSGYEAPPTIRKRRRTSLKNLPTEQLVQLSTGSLRNIGLLNADEENRDEIAFQIEREKIRLNAEAQLDKIRSDREKERDEMLIQRDQVFLKFVQDQLASNHALKQATQALVAKVAEKIAL